MTIHIRLPGPDSVLGDTTVEFTASPQWQAAEHENSVREGWIDTDCQSATVSIGTGGKSYPIPTDLALVLATIGHGLDPTDSADVAKMGSLLESAILEDAEDERLDSPDDDCLGD